MISRVRSILPAAGILALVLLAPAAAAAQSFGVHGGASYSRLEFKQPPSIQTDRLWGGTGGVFVTLGGRGPFGGLVEANWLQRGTKTPSGSELKVSYLEVPVAARLTFGPGDFRIFAIGGGTIAFKLSASQSGTPIFEDLDTDVDGFDHAAIAGGGIEYKQLVVDGRYTWGTRDISDRPIEAYNRGWTFLVGYKLLGR